MRRTLRILLVVALATTVFAQKSNINDFKRKLFKFSNMKPGIYELDIGFDDSKESWVAAFGDVDQTSYTDVILADKTSKVLSLFKWGDK